MKQQKEKWIIGDIHGCFETLMALIIKLPPGTKSEDIMYCGDMIDRGPDTRSVINYIRESGSQVVKGNHEELMCSAIESMVDWGAPLWNSDWVQNGGGVYLDEYKDEEGNIDNAALQTDYEWLLNLPVVAIADTKDEQGRNLVVSHATSSEVVDSYIKAVNIVVDGITEEITEHHMIDYKHQVSNLEMIMMWDRKVPKHTSTKYFNVFGHTPIDNFAFKGGEVGGEDKVDGCLTDDYIVIDKKRGYANIDSGCCYNKKKFGKFRGSLTAISFPGLEVIQQENIDV